MVEENISNISQQTNEDSLISNLLTFEENTETSNFRNEPQPIIVKVEYPPENKEPPTSKFVNIAGIVINLILAILTYFLYQQTVFQSQQSAEAVKVAMDAVSEAKKSNKISEKNYELAKISFEGNNESTNRTIDLAEKSLNSQLLSINNAQQNFEIENKPYLEIRSISLLTLEVSKPFGGTFDIVNHGNSSIQTIKIILKMGFLTKKEYAELTKSPKSLLEKHEMRDDIFYITKGFPLTLSLNGGKLVKKNDFTTYNNINDFKNNDLSFTQDAYEAILNGTHTIIFYGKVLYLNPVNKKKRLFSFIIQPILGGEDEEDITTWATIYNENIDI